MQRLIISVICAALLSLHAFAFEKCDKDPVELMKDNAQRGEILACRQNSLTDGTEYSIGWSASCAIPSGGTRPSNRTCITTPQLAKVLVDAITTLGISELMKENFCGALSGEWRTEGSIVSQSFVHENCSSCLGTSAECSKCSSNLLLGRTLDVDGTYKPFKSEVLDKHLLSGKTEMFVADPEVRMGGMCDGIPNYNKPVLDEKGRLISRQTYSADGKSLLKAQLFCPLTRCDVPTQDIQVQYIDTKDKRAQSIAIGTATAAGLALASGNPIAALFAAFGGGLASLIAYLAGDEAYYRTLTTDQTERVGIFGIVRLMGQSENSSDHLCASMWFPTGWTKVACKRKSERAKPVKPSSVCAVRATSCSNPDKVASQTLLPITSKMIQCSTELIDSTFQQSCCDQKKNPIVSFQRAMKETVRVALVLYVIFLGIGIIFGWTSISPRELLIFALKVGFVIWVAIGYMGSDPQDCSSSDKNGLFFLKDVAQSGLQSFSNFFVPSGGSALCAYQPTDYKAGHEYLAIWDSIDCRISHYLGLNVPSEAGKAMAKLPFGAGVLSSLFSYITPLLFSFNVVPLLLVLVFVLMILSVVIYLVQVYIISAISIAVLIFMGPVFVPMVLFRPTAQYFQGWLTALLGYAIQPAVIVAFVSLMFSVFDLAVYPSSSNGPVREGCQFVRSNITPIGSDKSFPFWSLDANAPADEKCQRGLGYMFVRGTFDGKEPYKLFGLFTVNVMNVYHLYKILDVLLLCAFFAFLFYAFTSQLDSFVSSLALVGNGGAAFGSGNSLMKGVGHGLNFALKVLERGGGSSAKRTEGAGEARRSSTTGVAVSGPASATGVAVHGQANPAGTAAGVAVHGQANPAGTAAGSGSPGAVGVVGRSHTANVAAGPDGVARAVSHGAAGIAVHGPITSRES